MEKDANKNQNSLKGSDFTLLMREKVKLAAPSEKEGEINQI